MRKMVREGQKYADLNKLMDVVEWLGECLNNRLTGIRAPGSCTCRLSYPGAYSQVIANRVSRIAAWPCMWGHRRC